MEKPKVMYKKHKIGRQVMIGKEAVEIVSNPHICDKWGVETQPTRKEPEKN